MRFISNNLRVFGQPHRETTRHYKMNKFIYAILLVLAGTILPAVQASASAQEAVDAVLVLDSSGSMKKTDPNGLRIPAAKMFISLLNKGDRSSVVSFSDQGYPVVYLNDVKKYEKRLHQAADKISTKGIHTNIAGALKAALQVFEQGKVVNKKRFIIFMSDGKMDVGDRAKEQQLSKEIDTTIIPELLKQDIKVYSIAFTSESDLVLLKKMAKQTGGQFHLAKTDKELHEVYSKIFEDGKNPDMLPIENGELFVDASISEVTIVASKVDASTMIAIESPEGKRYTEKNHPKSTSWFSSHYFEMITISKPQQGKWRLFSSGKADKAYVVTDLSLAANLGDSAIATGSEATIAAWLEMKGHVVKAPEMLKTTKFNMEILLPGVGLDKYELLDKGVDNNNAEGDGIVSNTLAFDKPGRYEVTLKSIGATFQRERTFHLDVEHPVAPVTPIAPVAVEQQAVVEAAVTDEPEPTPEQAELVDEGELVGEQEPENVPIDSEPLADTVEQPAIEDEEGLSNEELVTGFAIGNVLLIVLGAVVLWMKKRKKKSKDEEDSTIPEIEDENLDSLDALPVDTDLESLDELADQSDSLDELPVDTDLDSLDDLDGVGESLDELSPDEGATDELDELADLDLDSDEKKDDEVDPLDDLGENLDDLLKDDTDNPEQK